LGSREPILESLNQLQQVDLQLNLVACGLGNITEVDVERAEKQQSLLIGFNVKPKFNFSQSLKKSFTMA
jgi:translation initiation factor IF-2